MNKVFAIIIVIIVIAGGVFLIGGNYKKSNMNDITLATENDIGVTPISHASLVLSWGGMAIYTDPTEGAKAYAGQPRPDLILLTDIHGDHLDPVTLADVSTPNTILVMPQAVADEINSKLPGGIKGTFVVLPNAGKTTAAGFSILAIPMYNLPESPTAYHTKGRGNGYVIERAGKRVYISGDTSNIPEMRELKDIDLAFVCMNLPYTMSIEEAAQAVLAFQPKVVTPYHYRGQSGLSDILKFRDIVNEGNPGITVDIMDFYPNDVD